MATNMRINSLRNLKNFSKMFDPKRVTDKIVAILANEGYRIIKKAYDSRRWNNRTYNLHNSYVSAVYVKGKLRTDSIRYLSDEPIPPNPEYAWKAENRPYGDIDIENGRKEAENFLASYGRTHKTHGIRLVVAAAMFYSGFLEAKGYRVLSTVQADLENLSREGLFVTDSKVTFTSQEFVPPSNQNQEGIIIPPKYLTVRSQEIESGSKTFSFF
jgi:hypothetical protein